MPRGIVLFALTTAACVRFDAEVQPNAAPTARVVAADLRVAPLAAVVLDGSPSSDSDGDPLTFSWEQVETGSEPVTLVGAAAAVASFTAPPRAQSLFFRLTVHDGAAASAPAVLRVDVVVAANGAPVAVAAEPEIVAVVGATVALDGSGSSDPEGAPLSFRWEQVAGSGDPVTVANSTQAVASFTAPDRAQRLFFRLFVSDGLQDSLPALVRVDVVAPDNTLPVAAAAAVLLDAQLGELVLLDGSSSADADGDVLTFSWTQVEGSGELVNLTGAYEAVASFTAPDAPQRLFFRLVVSDGLAASPPLVVRVDVAAPPNSPPLALAAADALLVATGATVVLDGSASSDADGDPLTFNWSQIEGIGDPISLTNGGAAIASFTAPDVGQRLFFRLVVSDGRAASQPAIVRVTVNGVPLAVAPPNQSTPNQTPILLEGAGYDPDGDLVVSYAWSVTSAPPTGASCVDTPSPCLSGADNAAVIFTPPAKGDYVLELVVSDGALASPADTVLVRATSRKPVAVPEADQAIVINNATVNLYGGNSTDPDPGESIAAFRWTVQSTPTGGTALLSPSAGNVADPTVQLLGKGTYFVSLVVTDSEGVSSEPASLRLDALNNTPTAFAGVDIAAPNGSTVNLLGVGTDVDGDPLTYAWSLVDAPPGGAVTLGTPSSPATTLLLGKKTLAYDAANCGPGDCYRLSLVVSDGFSLSAADAVVVTSLNRPPLANAGPSYTAPANEVVLDGSSSSDPDGDRLVEYRWTQVEGADLTGGAGFLLGQTVSITTNVVDAYTFDLVVSDGEAASAPSRVVVRVGDINRPPVLVLANSTSAAVEGTTWAGLDASGSTDPDGDPVTVIWTRRSGSPAAFPASFAGAQPVVTAPAFGAVAGEGGDNFADYDVVASDGTFESAPQSVRLFTLPGADFVVVAPGGNDSASPACGSVATPCGSLGRALTLIDTAPVGDGIGNGRDIVLLSGLYNQTQLAALSWLGGTSLIAGREPGTFARSAESRVTIVTNGCAGTVNGIYLPPAVGPEALLTNVRFGFQVASGCINIYRNLYCDGCRARFSDVEIVLETVDQTCTAVVVDGPAAEPLFERTVLRTGACSTANTGLRVTNGAAVTLRGSTVRVSTHASAGTNYALHASGSDVDVSASVIELFGPVPSPVTATAAVSIDNGVASIENTVIINTVAADTPGALFASSSSSLVNDTILGPAQAGVGIGVSTTNAPLALMNNVIAGFGVPLRLGVGSNTPKNSLLYANAIASTSPTLADCNGTSVTTIAELNASPGSTCNTSSGTWSDNVAAACPLVNAAGGDYHLNTGVQNACVDGGRTASLAGVAPPIDRDGEARPAGVGVDIGADEAR